MLAPHAAVVLAAAPLVSAVAVALVVLLVVRGRRMCWPVWRSRWPVAALASGTAGAR